MAEANIMQSIVIGFEANIRELRVFNDKIGTLAEQHDKSTVQVLKEDIARIIGIDIEAFTPPNISENINIIDASSDASNESVASESTAEMFSSNKNIDATIKNNIERSFKDPKNIMEFIGSMNKFVKGAMRQGVLLRRGALVSLISYYEALISDLIHHYYKLYPAALPADTRVLSLNDLREIGSIEEAEKHLVSKEVDSVLREGYEQQLRYFTERLKIDLKYLDEQMDYLVEINQRRNIVVHNNSVVNRTYIKNVENKLLEEFDAKEGKDLAITREYLNKAIDMIYICGIITSQQCIRKWDKIEKQMADDLIISHTYDALLEERYDLAIIVAAYAEKIKMLSDQSKKIVTINHAIALKAMGKNDDMEIILKRIDWSASSMNFQVALRALRGERESFYVWLTRAVKSGEIDRNSLEQWPLFKEFREEKEFQEICQGCPHSLPKMKNSAG